MMVELLRFAHTPFGTFGRMVLEDGTRLFTLENQWDDNWPNSSCIPPAPGQGPTSYDLIRDMTGRHRWYKIEPVPGRSAIEIHPGNTDLDSRGCVLLGTSLGWTHGRWAIAGSRPACEILRGKLGNDTHTLRIAWSFAGAGK